MDNNDKSILVVNETSDTQIELYCYESWDIVCWLSSFSKIILPGTSYLYRIPSSFKFQLVAKAKDTKKKTILSTREWGKNALFRVTGNASNEMVEESDLIDSCQEKQTCVRRQNMLEECSENGYNLYEVLKLDIKEVRSKSDDEQGQMIKKAYRREIRRWHPDKNEGNGDEYICTQIFIAYKILFKPETRADYNNVVDYDNGKLSISRWKSMLWSECPSADQKVKFRKRMGLLFFSVALTFGGVAVSILTAGLALPVVIGCGILGGAMIGGGIQSGLRTINRESIEKGCDFKKYTKTMAIGMVAGAVSGGAAIGVAAGIIGIGSSILSASETTIGHYIATGAATGATGGVITAVGNDLETTCVDLKNLSWEKIVKNILKAAALGGALGALGSLAIKAGSEFSTFDEDMVVMDSVQCVEDVAENLVMNSQFKSKCERNKEEEGEEGEEGEKCGKSLYSEFGRVHYISHGKWFSKMVVQYSYETKVIKKEVEGSRGSSEIPENATNIEVSFQVERFAGVWCDVKKYNRFDKFWIEPTKPHIFKYAVPTIRTFTLRGGLYFEAVMKVTGEHYEEVDDM